MEISPLEACFVGVHVSVLRAFVIVANKQKALDTFDRDRWLFVYGPFSSIHEAAAWRDLYNLPDKEVIADGE